MLRGNRRHPILLAGDHVLCACEINEVGKVAVERGRGIDDVELNIRARIACLVVERLHVGPAVVQRSAHIREVRRHLVGRLAHHHKHADRADRVNVAGIARARSHGEHRRAVLIAPTRIARDLEVANAGRRMRPDLDLYRAGIDVLGHQHLELVVARRQHRRVGAADRHQVVGAGRREIRAADRHDRATLSVRRLERGDVRADEPRKMQVEPVLQPDRRFSDRRINLVKIEHL